MKLQLPPFLNISSLFSKTSNMSSDLGSSGDFLLQDGNNDTVAVLHLESPMDRMTRLGWEWFLYFWSLVSPYITTPVLVLFIFPLVICVGIYMSALLMYIVRLDLVSLFRRLRTVVLEERDLLKAGREMVSTIWDAHGWIWHGFEVQGLENIPNEGPALIIYYHGALPVDYYYFVAKVLLLKQRMIHSVVDRFLFKVPGLRGFLNAFQCYPGSVEECAEELRNGHLLGLAPGGVYEAQYSTNNYEILWKDRLGFARIALAAKAPVIPMFTANVREAFRTVSFFRTICEPIYARFKLPLMPMYGGFPVKMTSYVGKPVNYDPENCTPQELRDKCRAAIKELIENHQKRPGSVVRALYQRVRQETNHVS